MPRFVDYVGAQDVSTHPGFPNVVMNVPRLLVDEVVYGDGLSENDRTRMVQPQQKRVWLMKDIISNFSGLASW